MADSVVEKADQAIGKPARGWRRRIIKARAIVGPAWRRYRASLFESYLIVAVVIFSILAILAHTVAYFTIDLTITQAIQEFRGGGFDAIMRFLTWLGYTPQGPLLIAFAVLFLYLSGLKWESVAMLLSNIGISILGTLIKVIVVRPRPSPDLVNVITKLPDYGFPSGHVLFFVTLFGFVGFLAFTLLKPSWLRRSIVGICLALVFPIGFSRIYLGAHWASDVIAAYLLSSVWLTLTVHFYRWGKIRFFVHQPVAKETPQLPQDKPHALMQ
ncbi:MAG: phosphatase PAP2 family protein [Chloroflexi bacterium]|nr:phosphatase PAP2 family protein [Chloroflexota bacterium]